MNQSTRITKNDMARVIVAALENMQSLPPADHFKVVNMAKRKKVHLESQHKSALNVINSRKEVTA